MHPYETDADEMLRFLLDFCAVSTVNGSEHGENDGAQFLYDSLKNVEYFKENPDCLFLQQVEDDPLGRCNMAAFLKSPRPTKKAILLSGIIYKVEYV